MKDNFYRIKAPGSTINKVNNNNLDENNMK